MGMGMSPKPPLMERGLESHHGGGGATGGHITTGGVHIMVGASTMRDQRH